MAYRPLIREFGKITRDRLNVIRNNYNESNNFGKYYMISSGIGSVGGVSFALSEVYVYEGDNDNMIKKIARCSAFGGLGYLTGPVLAPVCLFIYSCN